MTFKISKDDLRKVYGSKGVSREGYRLEALLRDLESSTNPLELREDIFGIAQLYTDGIIGGPFTGLIDKITGKENSWQEQKRVLDSINQTGIEATLQFYAGERINVERVRELILPYASEIVKYGSSELSKKRHLSPQIERMQNYGRFLERYPNAVGKIDAIVAVASGGFEPAYLLANAYGINDIAVPRYSSCNRGDVRVKTPKDAPADYMGGYCNGKNVAVVEDTVCRGESIIAVIKKVLEYAPKRIVGFGVEDGTENKEGTARVLRVFDNRHREEINKEPIVFEIRGDGK